MHQDAFVSIDEIASHCCASYIFPNTFGLKVKKGSNTLILGMVIKFLWTGILKITLRYNNTKVKPIDLSLN